MENIKKKFFRFLKENKLYSQFKAEFCRQKNIRNAWHQSTMYAYAFKYKKLTVNSFDDYVEELKNKKNILQFAFSWSSTEVGHLRWLQISKKWEKIAWKKI